MKYMDFIELSEKVIREENKPLTANEIWEIAKSKDYDKLLNSKGKTPWATIAARIYTDIKNNDQTKFFKPEKGKFFLKDLSQENSILVKDEKSNYKNEKQNFKERDLHKYLSYFVNKNGSVYTKTIFHEISNKQYSQWLHPDVVGVSFYFDKWQPEISEIVEHTNNRKMKLFSYELKKDLNFSNLRESYFQAVSNSSWANEGYLVSAYIDEKNEDLLKEIERLTNSFGIGIIRLDIYNPDLSKIIYPAKQKDIVDIETMNKLAQLNSNFKEFLNRINLDLKTKEIRKEKYDKVYSINDLIDCDNESQ